MVGIGAMRVVAEDEVLERGEDTNLVDSHLLDLFSILPLEK